MRQRKCGTCGQAKLGSSSRARRLHVRRPMRRCCMLQEICKARALSVRLGEKRISASTCKRECTAASNTHAAGNASAPLFPHLMW